MINYIFLTLISIFLIVFIYRFLFKWSVKYLKKIELSRELSAGLNSLFVSPRYNQLPLEVRFARVDELFAQATIYYSSKFCHHLPDCRNLIEQFHKALKDKDENSIKLAYDSLSTKIQIVLKLLKKELN